MSAGLPSSAVPASIHCDHLIQAIEGAEADLKVCSQSHALLVLTCTVRILLLQIKKYLISSKALPKNMVRFFQIVGLTPADSDTRDRVLETRLWNCQITRFLAYSHLKQGADSSDSSRKLCCSRDAHVGLIS